MAVLLISTLLPSNPYAFCADIPAVALALVGVWNMISIIAFCMMPLWPSRPEGKRFQCQRLKESAG